MAQSINTNLSALIAQKHLTRSSSQLSTAMERLSSGLRINSAKDDSAGLAITERQGAQIRGMDQAMRNANDGISLAQTAESALNEVAGNLQRMRELAVQSANGVYTVSDRISMQKEVQALQEEVGRSLKVANFNGISLFTESGDQFISTMAFQIGANVGSAPAMTTDSNRIEFQLYFDTSVAANGVRGSVNGSVKGGTNVTLFEAMVSSKIFGNDSTTSGVFGGVISANAAVTAADELSIVTQTGAEYAVNWIDSALNIVNDVRASFGALSNRFDSTVRNLQDNIESTTASRSRIRDADFAMETASLTRAQILQQAGVAMLAQANQQPQNVMRLLQ